MILEMTIAVALIVVGAISTVVFYHLGYHFGEQNAINRLLDAKDPESWNQAHYLRADKKAEEVARLTPKSAFAAIQDPSTAPTEVITRKSRS